MLILAPLTFPLARDWANSGILGVVLSGAAALFVAAGVGWRVVIRRDGYVFVRTWWLLPVYWRRLPSSASFHLVSSQDAPDEEWIEASWEGGKEVDVTSPSTSHAVLGAILDAGKRYHDPR